MQKRVPQEADWGDWEKDLDQRAAHSLYVGRTNEQMQERFVEAPIEAAEELQFMPRLPFQYYVLGFRDSVLSRKHSELDASDAASCFMHLVRWRLEHTPDDIEPVLPDLMPALQYVAEHQEDFKADPDVYGSFSDLLDQITALIKRPDAGKDAK